VLYKRPSGRVDRKPNKRIEDEIKKESEKLLTYKKAVGPDIRLLIVADRLYNSGKLMIEGQPRWDLRGFQTVYFFSYPDTIKVCSREHNAPDSCPTECPAGLFR
jgi:hypothetical protein